MFNGMLAGGGIAVVFFLLGRFAPARRRGPKPPKPVQPVCGCRHHRSYHEGGTGRCHQMVDGPATPVRSRDGKVVRDYYQNVEYTHEQVQCGCQHYTGPEPLGEIYAPEIAG